MNTCGDCKATRGPWHEGPIEGPDLKGTEYLVHSTAWTGVDDGRLNTETQKDSQSYLVDHLVFYTYVSILARYLPLECVPWWSM